MPAEPVKRIPGWTTKTTSYWGSPSGATYKVVKSGVLWNAFKYSGVGKWHKISTCSSKTEAQQSSERYENDSTGTF